MLKRHTLNALVTLFDLAKESRPATLLGLSRELELDSHQTRALLHSLEEAGLVDAERVRLTMSGLVVAVQHQAQARSGSRAA